MKKAATKEQKDEIFKYDKQKKSVKKKENKKRKARENRLRKQKEALDSAANTSSINGTSNSYQMCAVVPLGCYKNSINSTSPRRCIVTHLEIPKMKTAYKAIFHFEYIGQNEPMEMDVSDAVSTSRPVEAKAGAAAGSERKSAGRSTDVPVQQEILAAEEFERTTDCNVEFEFHVD